MSMTKDQKDAAVALGAFAVLAGGLIFLAKKTGSVGRRVSGIVKVKNWGQ